VVTGNPLRKEMVIPQKQKAREFFGLPPERFTLMVMGGSQGSSRLNDTFLAAVSEAPLKDKLQVIHLAGTQDYQSIKQRYQDLNIEARVFVFLQEMQYAYGASDLAFSRAGATTITELMFFKLPAVISPYPYAYQHQSANAAILKNAGCAVILEEQQLTPESLRRQIEALINDQERLRDMRASYEKIFIPQAAEALVREAADVR
jgi:UDP-N-acetylglucosamine--N-acetylmuramyl-(pentapeptide) pyrophosphoryl-undecaprenol N-acetylglucosamine transferase